jgi:hypothetical protein
MNEKAVDAAGAVLAAMGGDAPVADRPGSAGVMTVGTTPPREGSERRRTVGTVKRYVWSKERGIERLKPEATFDEYKARYPSALFLGKRLPGLASFSRWVDDGVCPAVDGCNVEPDGTCPHGCPSWLVVLGYI